MRTRRIVVLCTIPLLLGAQTSLSVPVQAATSISATYAVQDSLKFPQSVISEIKSHSSDTIAVPTTIKLDQPLTKGYELAIDLDVSSTGYSMDIFERQMGSNTSQWAMAGLVGDTETVNNLSSFGIPFWLKTSGYTSHRSIKLAANTTAVDYHNSKSYEEKILWGSHGWQYVADGMGIYENNTPAMANTIASFVAKRGVPVPNAGHGYVQALWSGNRPDYRVTWTYDGKQWYSLYTDTLTELLNTARSVAIVS